jgi:EpsI family protein
VAALVAQAGEPEEEEMIKFAVAMAFFGLNFYTYHYLATEPVIPARKTFEEFPLELGEWACPEREEMSEEFERKLGVTDYLICNYRKRNSREMVSVYVGYHETQVREEGGGSKETSIHPPAHCLPGSGWDLIDLQKQILDMPGLPGKSPLVNRLIIAKGELRQLVYYWYQSRGRVIARDWEKILYMGWDRATLGRTDGSLVRFTTMITRKSGEEAAEAAFRAVAPQLVALLPDYVPE